jgi:L-ascorbate metabolism protein UlaG (beta-lactamase superfamily)
MIISYHGVEFFKISQGDLTLAINPISKDSKAKQTRFGADVVLVSTNHSDMNGVENVSRGDKEPFVITGPGEYEIKDMIIKGFLSESTYGGERRVNTIYTITFEGVNLCFLGALSSAKLSPETLEALEDVDVMFVPIAGELGEDNSSGLLDPSSAYKLGVSLESKVIIPMHYNKEKLAQFMKEGGKEKSEALDKFVFKKKDLEGKTGEILVLSEE